MEQPTHPSLTDFLLARIAEDEAAARAAMKAGARWVTAADTAADIAGADAGLFILFHNPVRVLAECAAKRAIVERYLYLVDHGDTTGYETTLRALASVYADHPDFQEA